MRLPRLVQVWAAALLLSPAVLTGCATSHALVEHDGTVGVASYYAGEHNGHRTASGERFDMHALTAAHRTLPFDSRVRVTNLDNGRQVVVRINDRGPFRHDRIIDLSYAAARRLDMIKKGTARVRLEALGDATAE